MRCRIKINDMQAGRIKIFFTILIICAVLLSGCDSSLPLNREEGDLSRLSAAEQSVLATYGRSIPEKLSKKGVTAIAVALVDRKGVIWKASYGSLSTDGGSTRFDSLFSIQSMSKTFTTLATLKAVDDGLLDLNTPIAEYLPEFVLQTRFSDQPLEKITLRNLLNHTAGLTHEAPVGNNYDATSPSFNSHINSIQETWTIFPASTGYSYSNLGVDLAAYIVQEKSGEPFESYIKHRVFRPLGMLSTTADRDEIEGAVNRVIGHQAFMSSVPAYVPMAGSGGIYSNIDDLSKFLQSILDGRNDIVSSRTLNEMYIVSEHYPYGLGITVENNGSSTMYGHNGGGFGFTSGMHWIPEHNIAAVILTNYALETNVQSELTESLMRDFLRARDTVSLEPFNTKWPSPYVNFNFSPSSFKQHYSRYTGDYHFSMKGYELVFYADWIISLGFSPYEVELQRSDNKFMMNDEPLYEYTPGVFFTSSGEALDFRSGQLVYRGIKMDRL